MAKAAVGDCDLDTECVICHEEYTDPKLLPCLHTLCSHCLLSWISTNPKAPCPICSTLIIDVNKAGNGTLAAKIASMPPDLATDALVKSKAMLNKQQRCSGCQKTPVEVVCFDCQNFLCQSCLAIHRNFPMSRHHKVEGLASLTPERLAANQPTYCHVHADRPGELYCMSHGDVICHMCASCDHRTCPEIKPFEKRAEEIRSELDTMSSTLKAVEAEFDQFVEKVDLQSAENEQQSQRNLNRIDEDCDRLQRAVEICRRHLKEQENMDAARAKEQLAEVKSAALLSKRKIQTHRASLERAERAMPARFLSSLHAEMTARTSKLDMNGTPPVNVSIMTVKKVEVNESALERMENELKSLTLNKTVQDDGKDGTGSINKPGSQQGGPGSKQEEAPSSIPSLRQEITLHKSENPYIPAFRQKAFKQKTEAEEVKLCRDFRSILNKLTPEKFDKLKGKVLALQVNTEEKIAQITDIMFEKAIAEPKFANLYACLCKAMLALQKLPKPDNPNETISFRGVLLTKCQKEFESDKVKRKDLNTLAQKLAKAPADKKQQLTEELAAATTQCRRRSIGNIGFIGELFKLKMLTEAIMHDCIVKLLKNADDDSIECLTKLLETIGKDLDHPKAKVRMDQYFAHFDKITHDIRNPNAHFDKIAHDIRNPNAPKPKDQKYKLTIRVKFTVLNIVELREQGWRQRKIKDQDKPMTLGKIHQKAKQEQQKQQYLDMQPRMDLKPQSSRNKGRSSVQGGFDNWKTVYTERAQLVLPLFDFSTPLNFIAEELHNNQNIKEAKEDILELRRDMVDMVRVVTTLLQKVAEKAGKVHRLLGHVFSDLVRDRVITLQQLTAGIVEFMPIAQNLVPDIPGIWDNMAQMFAGALTRDFKVLSLTFLLPCLKALTPGGDGKTCMEEQLFLKIIRLAVEYSSKDAVHSMWASSKLKLSDFKVETPAAVQELSWLNQLPPNSIYNDVLDFMQQKPDCQNRDVESFLDQKYSPRVRTSPKFFHEVTKAVCRSLYNAQDGKLELNKGKVTRTTEILRKYVDNNVDWGFHVLVGIQHLSEELAHPKELATDLFDYFYDVDLVPEDSFFKWYQLDESTANKAEKFGRGSVKYSVKGFYEWLMSATNDNEPSS